ncbi:MAG: hypothetical protein HKO00_06285 [Flavobacteriaceae bacterium]|nr:hypothetical protein [Flavobacteriaceae bacterium]
MTDTSIYIGNSKANFLEKEVKGKLISIGNELYYKISNYDAMRPFFMSIVSDSNHWMFISSTGGLSAGRKNSDFALFPYYTDDKITEFAETTGSKTIILCQSDDKTQLWEPFSNNYLGVYNISRNLYKSRFGNKLIFEEINNDLGLTFKYEWNSSNTYGFVKKSTLINSNPNAIKLKVLDGLQNILPCGVGATLQNAYSNLVDAYKRNERFENTPIGLFTLSAIIVDKAEPSEALKATVAWSLGMDNVKYLISSSQLDRFRKGYELKEESDVKAEKGAYFLSSQIGLDADSEKEWITVANVNQNMIDISKLSRQLNDPERLYQSVLDDIDVGTKRLLELNGASDGIQVSVNELRNTRHFANTLFNIMRGGIFDDNYNIEKSDFIAYIQKSNIKVYKKKEAILFELPELFSIEYLRTLTNSKLSGNEDKNFKRLCYEYMPLKFSRRHGDPSRPWNHFSINTRSEIDGSKILDYQGNWRDIFQNWEALVHSYPEFIESMIHKFLNASTFDGYNPYRVMKNGFDWETIEPHDPWSYIGYWGDHQIIYLLKFLEFIENHYPNKLSAYFDQDVFVYANIPYKIKSYNDILKNPKDTIEFDEKEELKILQKRKELGVDGALLRDQNFFIYKVNLIEKLLATVLAKLSNFIPEGGIWMNTQRPEWNDANNALVGNGVSMVTLYYLRRFLNFFQGIVENSSVNTVEISVELKACFNQIVATLVDNQSMISGKVSDADRKKIMDGLGNAGSNYRNKIYQSSFSSHREELSMGEISELIEVALTYLDHSIKANKRADNLYHAYNLMTIKNNDEVALSHLSEMLEGQVAVLSSGCISGEEALKVLDALKQSALFRHDQYSYILYPNKELSKFSEKNKIPKNKVDASDLLKQLLHDDDNSIIEMDCNGDYHFNSTFNNAENLKDALSHLDGDKYKGVLNKERQLVLDIFEDVFDHKSFTGRSGTFFGYEGLGSIYWHMVSKLLLSVQEICLLAIENNESDEIIGRLIEHYYEINEGIGVHKSPELYGAFPTDPYSHTPAGKGAQQPGMTGQVKEDILCRFGELGISIKNGVLIFNPCLLRISEFLDETKNFNYVDLSKNHKSITLNKDTLAFTYCQIPIIYELGKKNRVTVYKNDDSKILIDGQHLNEDISTQIFKRSGVVKMLHVSIEKSILKK